MRAPGRLNVSARKFVVTAYECMWVPGVRAMTNDRGAALLR
jgi:hypothetical protein